jgi:hypothetical protein
MPRRSVDTVELMKNVIHTLADGVFRATGTGIKGIARYFPVAYEKVPTFQLNGRPVEHFIHRTNTGYPPYRMSERTIELALADIFLTKMRGTRIVEIGAVTPYYWPDRVATIVDPTDDHPAVTDHVGWEDWQPTNETILSISTFEHIGSGDYGLAPDRDELKSAVDKLLKSTCPFLVTYPPGYHAAFDSYIRSLDLEAHGVKIFVWIRPTRGNDWNQVAYRDMTPQRETYGPAWANVVSALYRGPDDLWS